MDAGVKNAIAMSRASLSEIDDTYASIVGQITSLGYDAPPSGVDRKQNIDLLIDYITTEIDEADFELDTQVSAYKRYISEIAVESAAYVAVKDEYRRMRNNSQNAVYLNGCDADADYTLKAIWQISSYSVKKDAESRDAVMG